MTNSANVLLLIWGWLVSSGNAVLITFDGPPAQPRSTAYRAVDYTESGILFIGQYIRNGGGLERTPENGSTYLQFAIGDRATMYALDGATFRLRAADFAEYSTVSTASSVVISGDRADGTTVSTNVAMDHVIDGIGPQNDFQTWHFGPEFTNLIRVELMTTGFSLDNVVLDLGPEPPMVTCSDPLPSEGDGEQIFEVHATIVDTTGNPLEVIWFVNDRPHQTNLIAPNPIVTISNVALKASFDRCVNTITITANNQLGVATCVTSVAIYDLVAPEILDVAAVPAILWPPNGRMVPVNVKVSASDTCSETSCRIVDVRSSDDVRDGDVQRGNWEIVGALQVKLRSQRARSGGVRAYTIVVECRDEVANASTRSIEVVVPHDARDLKLPQR